MTAPQRECRECGKVFATADRHTRCPKCRALVDCPSCDGKMLRGSSSCRQCLNLKGANNGHWLGGKIYHKAGYRMCLTDRGYVFEHRLVMESHLGRELLSNENVHHKNGVKDDNRLENLELWVKTQPAGQRVEDLVSWAHEILDRYEG